MDQEGAVNKTGVLAEEQEDEQHCATGVFAMGLYAGKAYDNEDMALPQHQSSSSGRPI